MRKLSILVLVTALSLAACSGASAGTTAEPTAAPMPLLRCSAQVSDSLGHHANLVINYSADNIAPLAQAASLARPVITLRPSTVTLTPSHPSAHIQVIDPGYTASFAVAFVNCSGYLDAKMVKRTTLAISL